MILNCDIIVPSNRDDIYNFDDFEDPQPAENLSKSQKGNQIIVLLFKLKIKFAIYS